MCDQEFEGQIPNKAKKIKAETDIDWISELPNSLIAQILSLLPVTDAYKTTILSKRWQNLWTCIDSLIFDSSETNCSTVDFVSFTDNVLHNLSCSKIEKFSLSFGFYSGSYISKIDKWLEFALNKNAEDVHLDVYYAGEKPYILPKVLCNNSSIQKLNCENCRLPDSCVLNWTSLKSLTLQGLFINDGQIEQITSSCPQLESLKLSKFCGFNSLHITSPMCTRVELIDHNGEWGEDYSEIEFCLFKIDAPYVQHLKISGTFDDVEIELGDLSSLVHADLAFSKDFTEESISTINKKLSSVRCANEVVVPPWFIELIYESMLEEKDVSLPLLDCKQLTIKCCNSKYFFLAIGTLLKSTPYLEDLKILILPEKGISSTSLHDNTFKGCLPNLKNAEVVSTACGNLFGGRADKTDLLECLNPFLEHAINLEKLVIAPVHEGCNICSTSISKLIENLLAFPRASNCSVVSIGSVTSVNFPEK